MSRITSPTVGAVVVAIALLLAAVSVAGSAVSVNKVSRDPYTNPSSYHATEVEADTFSSRKRVVAAFQAGRFAGGGASDIGWAMSPNGGLSWRHGFLPRTTEFSTPKGRFARESDPSVAYDAARKVWLISGLVLSKEVNPVAVIVSRSSDEGRRWNAPVTIHAATGSQAFDKDWIVCDDGPSSPHYGRCYAEWDDSGNGGQLHMAFSPDGGLKWSQSAVPTAGVIGGQPVVQPNGHVVMPIDNASGSVLESFTSTDGGVTYRGPVRIAKVSNHLEAGDLRSPALPSAGVNGAGRVYVAWSDCRFHSSCSANDIVFSSSRTGAHWTTVRRVPIDPKTSGVDHFLPGLGVATNTSGKRSKLALIYYYYPHTSCTRISCRLDVGFVSSPDGGARWSTPIRLAGPMRIRELPLTTQGYMVGDYTSVSLLTGVKRDPALSVFAVGLPVTGKTCTLGDVTSCDEPMEAPSRRLPTGRADPRRAVRDEILSRSSDHPASAPLTYH